MNFFFLDDYSWILLVPLVLMMAWHLFLIIFKKIYMHASAGRQLMVGGKDAAYRRLSI
jgi:hypothetical protein